MFLREKAVVYSLGIELFASFMPSHILENASRKCYTYFFFIVCEIHFSGFIEALDSKGILDTLKEVLRQPHNALTLQVSLSLRDR